MQTTTQQTETPKETNHELTYALPTICILVGLLISAISVLLRKNENP